MYTAAEAGGASMQQVPKRMTERAQANKRTTETVLGTHECSDPHTRRLVETHECYDPHNRTQSDNRTAVAGTHECSDPHTKWLVGTHECSDPPDRTAVDTRGCAGIQNSMGSSWDETGSLG